MAPVGTASGPRAISGRRARGVTGLLHGDARQFFCQLAGATLCAVWAFGATYVVFWTVNKVKSMRVTADVEREGLDMPSSAWSDTPRMQPP